MSVKQKATFKKIDMPWATEALEAKFDNALQLLTPNCKIFGGALRDLVANLPILGDLDILITSSEFATVRRAFAESPNWILDTSKSTETYQFTEFNRLRIAAVLNFKNVSNKVVQLIKIHNEDRVMEDDEIILNNIKSVDIRCCGLMLDMNNNLYEVVPGAYQDCKDKELKLNTIVKDKCNQNKIVERINKLVDRGWINLITDTELKLLNIVKTNNLQNSDNSAELITAWAATN